MRRANGTGNIVDLGVNRRRRYAIRVSYQERPGLWKQKYLSYHRTAKEAQEALETYLRSGGRAQDIGTTLEEVYNAWSERKYSRAGKASVASYKASWGRLSILGKREVRKITIDDLQAIIDKDEADGLSKSSINNDHMLMRALYKYARERDLVEKDLTEFVELPQVGAKMEKGAFTDLQLKKLEQMAQSGTPWADTVLMLCYTGFRITEFLNLTRFSYHEDGDYLQGGIKTAAGKDRIVPVHPKIKPYLSEWLKRDGERIICEDDGAKVSYNVYFKRFAKIAAELGAPNATPHWCRHTAASRMRMAGMEELAVKRILGHSDKDITDHYTHVDIAFLSSEIQKVS